MRSITVILIAVILGSGQHKASAQAPEYGALTYIAAGALVVNAGFAVFNGLALGSGTADHKNGKLGFIVGSVTTGAAVAGYAFSDKDDLEEGYFLMLGGCGAAAAVTGWLCMRADSGEDAHPGRSGLSVSPAFVSAGARRPVPGLVLSFDF